MRILIISISLMIIGSLGLWAIKNHELTEPVQWGLAEVIMEGDTIDLPKSQVISIDHQTGGYHFEGFQVNSCWGAMTFGEDNKLTVEPAACTEACCNSPNENAMIILFSKMTSYQFRENLMILSGFLDFPIVFRGDHQEFTTDGPSIEGNVTLIFHH